MQAAQEQETVTGMGNRMGKIDWVEEAGIETKGPGAAGREPVLAVGYVPTGKHQATQHIVLGSITSAGRCPGQPTSLSSLLPFSKFSLPLHTRTHPARWPSPCGSRAGQAGAQGKA